MTLASVFFGEVKQVAFELNLNTEEVRTVGMMQPVCVEPATPVREVLALLKSKRRSSVLVVRDNALLGIFTERDALRLVAQGADLDTPIEKVMVSKPVTLSETDTIATAIRKMSDGGYRRLPIVGGDGAPVGIVTVTGIVHFLVDHFPQTVYNLPPQPGVVMQEREGA